MADTHLLGVIFYRAGNKTNLQYDKLSIEDL